MVLPDNAILFNVFLFFLNQLSIHEKRCRCLRSTATWKELVRKVQMLYGFSTKWSPGKWRWWRQQADEWLPRGEREPNRQSTGILEGCEALLWNSTVPDKEGATLSEPYIKYGLELLSSHVASKGYKPANIHSVLLRTWNSPKNQLIFKVLLLRRWQWASQILLLHDWQLDNSIKVQELPIKTISICKY